MTDDTDAGGDRDVSQIRQALAARDIEHLRALIDRGLDLRARDANGYDALILAAFVSDDRLMPVLGVLVSHGVELNGITTYRESALRVVSRRGRYDAVRLLLDAGADERLLAWTPLIKATAIGSLGDMTALIEAGAPLEDRDWWSRTAWLVALHVGDIDKAVLLRDRGADVTAVGRCGTPPLFYAIDRHHTAMLRWLIELGLDIEQTDQFGTTALIKAAEVDHLDGIDLLLASGAEIDRVHNRGTALRSAASRGAIARLLEAGADPAHLSNECQRIALGLSARQDASALDSVTSEQFQRSRGRRFGTRNPQRMDDAFWVAMIRAGVNGYIANKRFKGPSSVDAGPVWCAQRFGQSLTILPDGRIVQIGGEHEDSYDPDFCIYNDVFVHAPDGSVRIFGYPESVFAPTDFHTATLCGDEIVIIGTLGYPHRRQVGQTPVYRLDTRDWTIECVTTRGDGPGWIHRHRAHLVANSEIRVTGGRVLTMDGPKQKILENTGTYALDMRRWVWSRRGSE
jgi:ankyrin repeat protein